MTADHRNKHYRYKYEAGIILPNCSQEKYEEADPCVSSNPRTGNIG